MGATKKKKVKKNKMLLNFIKEIRAEKMAHAPDSGGGNAPKKMDTDKRANKDKKKNVSAVEKPAANTKDNNVDSNEDSSKDSSKEKNKGKAKDDVTGKKKHEEKLDKSDKEKPSGDGVSKTSNKIGVPESSSSTTEKKLKKLILNVSPPKPPPTPPKPAKCKD
jgi:hypothetical protein